MYKIEQKYLCQKILTWGFPLESYKLEIKRTNQYCGNFVDPSFTYELIFRQTDKVVCCKRTNYGDKIIKTDIIN